MSHPVDTSLIEALAADVAREVGVSIYDVSAAHEGTRTIVRIFVDRDGGSTLGDCETVSRRLGALLEVDDPIQAAYVLEVSSPGVTRRLTKLAHYTAYLGRLVKVVFSEPIDGVRSVTGTLASVDDEGIVVEKSETTIRAPYARIKKANLEISQEELFRKGSGRK